MIHADKYRRDDDDRPRNSWDYGGKNNAECDAAQQAKGSDYVAHIDDVSADELKNGAVSYNRTSLKKSRTDQKLKTTLMNYEAYQRAELERRKIPIRDSGGDIASGWDLDDRPEFDRLCKVALRLRCPLVVPVINRLLRNRHFASRRQLPTKADFERLKSKYPGVPFVSLQHPDSTENEMAAQLSAIGMQYAPKRVTHVSEIKKNSHSKRELNWQKVKWMSIAGISNRSIARSLAIKESTIRGWKQQMFSDIEVRGFIGGPPPRGRPQKRRNAIN